jgi:hypothetical protein
MEKEVRLQAIQNSFLPGQDQMTQNPPIRLSKTRLLKAGIYLAVCNLVTRLCRLRLAEMHP